MTSPTQSPTVVDAPHEGPPGCGNGGWVCGLVAERLDALTPPSSRLPAAQVRLSAPTPVEVPLTWEVDGEAGDDGVTVRLLDGETVLASARRAGSPSIDVPDPVDLETARAAAETVDLEGHPYPGCFVCGPDNDAGLHIYAGEVRGRAGLRAATVTLPDDDLPTVSAALDCPGAFAVGFGDDALLLGTFTVEVHGTVPAGRELVVLAWEVGREGRKRHCGTALVDDGRVLASAASTWIEVTRQTIPGTAPAKQGTP